MSQYGTASCIIKSDVLDIDENLISWRSSKIFIITNHFSQFCLITDSNKL